MNRTLAPLVVMVSTMLVNSVFAEVSTGPGGSGVTVGDSDLISILDISDTFTGTADGSANPSRPYVAAIQPAPAYVVENTHGNLGRSWTGGFSFAQDPSAGGAGFVNGSPAYPGDANAGSATGFTQTGSSVNYGTTYGLRNNFIVQFDAVQLGDRMNITVDGAAGGIADASGISIFFRETAHPSFPEIGIYRAGVGETNTGLTSRIPSGSRTWNNYAVAFDRPNNSIEVFVNEVSRGTLDLNTFAGGAYGNFNSSAVTVGGNVNGGAGENRTWTDNAQIGLAQAPVGPPSLVTYVNFDESASGTGTAFDQVHANNGTFTGASSRTTGLIGTGAADVPNVAANGVSLGNGQNGINNLFSFTSGITVEALFSSTMLSDAQHEIFRKEDGGNRILLSFQSGGNTNNASGQFVGGVDDGLPGLSFGLNVNGTYAEMDVELDGQDGRPTLADLNDGEIHHVAATYDALSGLKSIYIDGELIGQVDLPDNLDIVSGGAANAFIGSSNGSSEPFAGTLDEFAIYGAALSADEVAAHFRNVQFDVNYFAAIPEPTSVAMWILLGVLGVAPWWRTFAKRRK